MMNHFRKGMTYEPVASVGSLSEYIGYVDGTPVEWGGYGKVGNSLQQDMGIRCIREGERANYGCGNDYIVRDGKWVEEVKVPVEIKGSCSECRYHDEFIAGPCAECFLSDTNEFWEAIPGPVAILSTTVLPLDGTYSVATLPTGEIPDLTGIPHFIGHPDTKAIVESLGAVPASTKLFAGLQPGERAICFPITQGLSSRATEGYTSPHQTVDLSMLSVRVIIRIE